MANPSVNKYNRIVHDSGQPQQANTSVSKMESPASKRMRLSANRTSISNRRSITGASTIPRANNNTASNRLISASQPSYDFLAGETDENEQPQSHQRPPSRPPSRTGSVPVPLKRTQLRQSISMIPKPEGQMSANNQQQHAEEVLALRAKIKSLEYELNTLQDQRGLLVLQHEKELNDAQALAKADYAKFQQAEAERIRAVRMAEQANKDVSGLRTNNVNEKAALEKKARDAQLKYETLLEEKTDLDAELSELRRDYDRFRIEEVDNKRNALQRELSECRSEFDSIQMRLDSSQKRLEERDGDVERLEKQVLTLKSVASGGEELDVLKRELNEQIEYVRRLEGQVRDQNSELRKLRDERRSVQVVEEEKRALETEVQVLKEAERRAGELEIQNEILADEKRMWTSLLEREGQEGGPAEFESPEAVIKALVNERIEHAVIVERLGGFEVEMSEKDETIRALEMEKNALADKLAHMPQTAGTATSGSEEQTDAKAYKRLERQRQLAVKEVEYLRAQLKTFDTEETMMMDNKNFDIQRTEQVRNLESLVDEYKTEISTLHANMSKLESQTQPTSPRGIKRPASDEASADSTTSTQLAPLLRKNKNLQTALQKTTTQLQQLAHDLQSTKSQLKALRASKATPRILELRDNPTSQHEAIKQSTLRTLKAENAALMLQLRGENLSQHNIKTIPMSSLEALNMDLQEMEKSLAEKDKRARRQREIWTEKAIEFRDVIASILGFKVHFLPNGKVKISSLYYKSSTRGGDEDEQDDEDEEEENFILFDGEKGTMKISGGNEGEFGKDIKQLVDFWVNGNRSSRGSNNNNNHNNNGGNGDGDDEDEEGGNKTEIPCLMAAMTLEFYERFGSISTVPAAAATPAAAAAAAGVVGSKSESGIAGRTRASARRK